VALSARDGLSPDLSLLGINHSQAPVRVGDVDGEEDHVHFSQLLHRQVSCFCRKAASFLQIYTTNLIHTNLIHAFGAWIRIVVYVCRKDVGLLVRSCRADLTFLRDQRRTFSYLYPSLALRRSA